MPTFIRLTEYRDSDSKEAGFFDPRNRHTANQDNFFKIPGNPIAYWVSQQTINIFEKYDQIYKCSISEGQNITANNDKYLRLWFEVNNTKIEKAGKWRFYAKGGEFRKWFGNIEYVIDWSQEERNNYRAHSSARIIPEYLQFREGVTWTLITSSKQSYRLLPDYATFDKGGSSIFFDNYDDLRKCLLFLNTKISAYLTKIFNATLNLQVDDVRKLPISPSLIEINEEIYQILIDISHEEWDSRETSWDFHINELIRHKTNNHKIQTTYDAYCAYWREKFLQLHANEEELNRLFIEIYGLEEELTPNVPLEDITILKSESKIIDDELVFNADEIARQFISYAVGCMFGRYSLDRDGLVIANMGQAIPTDTSFEIDDDNIIPVLEEEVFSDDIAARFEHFVAVAFGDEFVGENIRWIEQSVGMEIRKYFVAEFYKDHVRRYKKRPIYWMVQSPKKGFSALIYMHRYQSDTMARVQTMYLREYLTKIDSLIEHTRSVSNNPDSSAKDAKEAGKSLTKLEAKQRDALDFDRGDMSRVAALQIAIDLDDGVKVNYQKFKGVLPDIGLSKGED